MNKGERTRQHILDAGFKHSSQYGLADITIGTLSKLCNLSRTGVISHFQDKESMQMAILEYIEQQFMQQVLVPTRQHNTVARIEALMLTWNDWAGRVMGESGMGCPLIKAAVEYQNRPDSPVRQFALAQQARLLSYLQRQVAKAVEQQQLPADINQAGLAYELYSLYLGHLLLRDSLGKEQAALLYRQSLKKLLAA
ncbi:TetR/AcrR family transcriptional regulator [Bowmanella pacifica]|uniref:HTH tetR-type domain-containing protein n=1 Tax=Bowmanella pacifica TaxID=502051 RepID=A0A918DJV9_9ALTE|nr:TetR/AcrR family transcriptional regulator [Bowmanella pacifica]GGO68239.1 hypothetical protein GCM10010982_16690 [Bowmanella pacifica]